MKTSISPKSAKPSVFKSRRFKRPSKANSTKPTILRISSLPTQLKTRKNKKFLVSSKSTLSELIQMEYTLASSKIEQIQLCFERKLQPFIYTAVSLWRMIRNRIWSRLFIIRIMYQMKPPFPRLISEKWKTLSYSVR